MITFTCASCQKKLSVKDELAGKKGTCPACGQSVAVPPAAARAAPAAQERTLPPKSRPQSTRDSLSDAAGKTNPGTGRKGGPTQPIPVEGPSPELWDFLAPAERPDEIGRLGGYRVLRVLGAGGMGVVFQAEDTTLKRKVALKAMLPALAASETAKQRFLREAQTAAAIEHDHIVPIYQVGEDRGVPFIAMPFLKGEPLDRRLQRDGALPVAEVLRIGQQTARGLAAAHTAGLIHRDIKPANLWLEGEEGRVKILDFGLARASSDSAQLTQQGAIIGTPAYMAPEQATGQALDGRCDLFSLGCVLYCMCTGQLPFQGEDTISTLMAVAMNQPPAPEELRPDLPPALSELVMQLLAKKPEGRPASAQVVADALLHIQTHPGARTMSARRSAADVERVPRAAVPTHQAARAAHATLQAPSRSRPRKKKRPLWPWLVGAGVVGMGVLAVALIVWWPTPQGTVRIESNDPGVEVVFDWNGPTIRGTDSAPVTLRAGEHAVLVRRGYLTCEADRLIVKKGQAIILQVISLPHRIQLVHDGQVIASRDLPLPPAAAAREPPAVVRQPPARAADPWVAQVAALAPARQVEVVADRLKERNPGFDGHVEHTVEYDVVTELRLVTDQVWDLEPLRALTGLRKLQCNGSNWGRGKLADLSPLQGLKLSDLNCWATQVSNLSPLQGMKLNHLVCGGTRVADLSPLAGMPLKILDCPFTPVSDLSPLADMPLDFLDCGGTQVSDLAPLKRMPLKILRCGGTRVSDLSPLKGMALKELQIHQTQVSSLSPLAGMPLTSLMCPGTPVSDLSPLRGMPLTMLHCQHTPVSDLSPLWGMPLKNLWCDFEPERDTALLRSLKTLEWINGQRPVDFWRRGGRSKFVNSLGMEFVRIPKGKFWMGGGDGKPGAQEVDIPQDFFLGRFEVTQEEWQKVMGGQPSFFSHGGRGARMIRNTPPANLRRFPVESVSWKDCQEFINRLNDRLKENGWVYRLPTAAEWEYACRGGPLPKKEDYGFDFYLDNPASLLPPGAANFNNQLKRTCRVGSYVPNRLGLYDMHGNVAEWCEDSATDERGVPQRVVRGGGWNQPSGSCRAAYRGLSLPTYRASDLGLRLARVPVGKDGK
jgi:formylglycine-generating enzyme required for sulfatase activity/tRNA A-37 threonylcarbamoyl transferase component Bud32